MMALGLIFAIGGLLSMFVIGQWGIAPVVVGLMLIYAAADSID